MLGGWGRIALLLTLVVPGRAQASYVKTCTLDAVVLSAPTSLGEGRWALEVDVARAERGPGRCDGSCDDLKGKRRIELTLGDKSLVPRAGQRVRLQFRAKHNRGAEPTERYELAP